MARNAILLLGVHTNRSTSGKKVGLRAPAHGLYRSVRVITFQYHQQRIHFNLHTESLEGAYELVPQAEYTSSRAPIR